MLLLKLFEIFALVYGGYYEWYRTNNIISKAFCFLYKKIFLYVLIFWILHDNSSQKTSLDVANTAEVNNSLCTTYPGFNAYRQTYSSSSVKGLDGSYRIGVKVHYSGEVTTLRSIQYFNTYFIFSKYIHSLFCRYTVKLSLC